MDNLLIQSLGILGFGFLLGLKHALDADHVVAVSTMVSQEKSLKKSSLLGVFWGAGHTLIILLAGAVMLTLKIAMPQKIALSLELIIGVMLIALGVEVLAKAYKEKIHIHAHSHGDIAHMHFHAHKKNEGHLHSHKSFLVGMMHGLAGSAAIMLLLVGTVESFFNGMFFIAIFGAGSIMGMIMISTIIGLPFYFSGKIEGINRWVKIAAGFCSISIGAFIVYEIAFLSHLLF